MPYSTLTSKGQTTIPREIRRLLGLKEKDRILYEIEDGKVAIKSVPSVHELYGVLKPHFRRKGAPATKAQMRAAVERDIIRQWKKKGRLMPRLLLDTNVVVRFLTGDHPTHSPRSRRLFARAAAGEISLVLSDVALAETAWVLQSFYSLDRAAIASALKGVIESTGIEVDNRPMLLNALKHFAHTPVNFIDAYHAAVAAAESIPIASFDRDFDRFANIKRFEPQS